MNVTLPLSPIGEKIFLDRYALKDPLRALEVGDLVLVQTDAKTGQREIGNVEQLLERDTVAVRLRSGELVERGREHVDKPLETDPGQMADRVARAAAQPEVEAEGWGRIFRGLLEGWKFVPGGRILTGAGTDQNLTFFNCFVVPSPHDSLAGIFETQARMARIMSRGGGVGINISTLRPRYSYVRGVNGRTSGSVSWGALYSFVTGLIEQGGSRRGALMLILNVWHPDVIDFIDSKRTAGNITNANISVGISDEFMAAVAQDLPWILRFPDTTHPSYDTEWRGDLQAWEAAGLPVVAARSIPARTLWQKIVESAHASAEPGVWFMDRALQESNSYYYPAGRLVCTNPCGEQCLPEWAVCNLGHVNLSGFVLHPFQDRARVDWASLASVIRQSVRFLDNVIDVTPYFYEENRLQQHNERRVGLGTLGLAEMLIKLGIRYGSPHCLEFLSDFYARFAAEAYSASVDLAEEKGCFPLYEHAMMESGYMKRLLAYCDKTDDFHGLRGRMMRHGCRNVTLLTQAPTGTVGTMVGSSTGIEPFYFWRYLRKSRLGQHWEVVGVVEEYGRHIGEPVVESCALPDYFVSAMDLTPGEHVRVQAAIQPWVDSSISKTSNLPASYTVQQVGEIYRLYHELGCKGGTIYRDKSRDEQVLSLGEAAPVPELPPPSHAPSAVLPPLRALPRLRHGVTTSRNTPLGTAHFTANTDDDGRPLEVFMEIGKGGSDSKAMAEALGRLVSLVLRVDGHTTPLQRVQHVVQQLRGIGGARSTGFGAARVTSLPDALAGALGELWLGGGAEGLPDPLEAQEGPPTGHADDLCPGCGNATLRKQEGCELCVCGFSAC